MIRVQVQFTDEQLRRLREQARRRDASVAEVVRQYVVRGLVSEQDSLDARYERAMAFVGSVADPEGATNVAMDHDAYLAESYQ